MRSPTRESWRDSNSERSLSAARRGVSESGGMARGLPDGIETDRSGSALSERLSYSAVIKLSKPAERLALKECGRGE